MRSHFLRAAQKAGDTPESPFMLVGSSTVGTATSGGTITAQIPNGTEAGDFILVVHSARSTSDLNMSLSDLSYTTVADLYANDTYDANLGVHWKISNGTETTLDLPGGTGFIAAACAVQVWRGVDTTSPLDVTPSTATGIDTWKAVNPGITTVTPGSLVVVTASMITLQFSNALFPPAGYDNELVASPVSGFSVARAAVASKYSPSAGALLAGAWSSPNDGAQYSWCACTLALRPA